jgi:hypothetical protein
VPAAITYDPVAGAFRQDGKPVAVHAADLPRTHPVSAGWGFATVRPEALWQIVWRDGALDVTDLSLEAHAPAGIARIVELAQTMTSMRGKDLTWAADVLERTRHLRTPGIASDVAEGFVAAAIAATAELALEHTEDRMEKIVLTDLAAGTVPAFSAERTQRLANLAWNPHAYAATPSGVLRTASQGLFLIAGDHRPVWLRWAALMAELLAAQAPVAAPDPCAHRVPLPL